MVEDDATTDDEDVAASDEDSAAADDDTAASDEDAAAELLVSVKAAGMRLDKDSILLDEDATAGLGLRPVVDLILSLTSNIVVMD